MSFDDLLIGFFQFIQKRCDRRAAVKHPGFLDIDIVDRDMECRRQGTDDLDETRLAVAVHDNPVFMKGNGKLQQLLAASLSTATRRPDRIKGMNSLGSSYISYYC